jgi:hypothetical protein
MAEPLEEYLQEQELTHPTTQEAVLTSAVRRSSAMNNVVRKAMSRRKQQRLRKQAAEDFLQSPENAGVSPLANMGHNAGRFSSGLWSTLGGGLGTIGGLAAGGWKPSSVTQQTTSDSARLARAGLKDMGSSLVAPIANAINPRWMPEAANASPENWATNQALNEVRGREGVTPGVADASTFSQRFGNLAGDAAIAAGGPVGAGGSKLLSKIPGVTRAAQVATQPVTARGAAGAAGALGTMYAQNRAMGAAAPVLEARMNQMGEPTPDFQAGQQAAQQAPQEPSQEFQDGQQAAQQEPSQEFQVGQQDAQAEPAAPAEPAAEPQAAPQPTAAPQPAATPSEPTLADRANAGEIAPPEPSLADRAGAGEVAPPGPTPIDRAAAGEIQLSPDQVSDEHLAATHDQSLTRYAESLPPEQQSQFVQRAWTAKAKQWLDSQNVTEDQKASLLGSLQAKAEQGGWTPDDLHTAFNSAMQSVDPSGQAAKNPSMREQIWNGVQHMNGWQIGSLILGAGLGLVGLMQMFGGENMFGGMITSLLGVAGAAYGSGAFDKHLEQFGIPTMRQLTGGLPGGNSLQDMLNPPQQSGAAQQPAGPPRPPEPTLADRARAGEVAPPEPTPEQRVAAGEQAGTAAPPPATQPATPPPAAQPAAPPPAQGPVPKYPEKEKLPQWAQPYTAGGNDPQAFDQGDVKPFMTDWYWGRIKDPQVQSLVANLPREQKAQILQDLQQHLAQHGKDWDTQAAMPKIQLLQQWLSA